MKYYDLLKEEQEILDEIEKGNFIRDPNFEEEKKKFQIIARNTLNKTKNINIRLTAKDVAKLKRKAAEEGIPYQTLASSVLHKFASK